MGSIVLQGIMTSMNTLMKTTPMIGLLRAGAGKPLPPPGLRQKIETSAATRKIKSWLSVLLAGWMPEGYEDERGFHLGIRAMLDRKN